MRCIRYSALLIAVALLLVSGAPARAGTIGITWNGDVYDIDTTAGTQTLIGPSGFVSTNSMAAHSGVIYSYTSLGSILTIDPLTGLGTALVGTSTALDVRGMAISAGGTMFLVTNGGGLATSDELWTVDIGTGAATRIGSTVAPGLQALAFGGAGSLYAWDINTGLHTVNPSTGLATDVNSAIGDVGTLQSLDFAPDGTAFGISRELYTIDPTTGAQTLVGSRLDDFRGIATVSSGAVVPLPSAAWAGLGLLGILGAARRFRKRNAA